MFSNTRILACFLLASSVAGCADEPTAPSPSALQPTPAHLIVPNPVFNYRVALLPGLNGAPQEGSANSVNANGVIVGNLKVGGSTRAVKWENGVAVELPIHPLQNASEALGINGSGDIVGWYSTSSQVYAARWTATQIIPNGNGGGVEAAATAVNDNKVMVGYSLISGKEKPIVWSTTTTLPTLFPTLPTFAGQTTLGGRILGVNASGVMVGFVNLSPAGKRGVRWTSTGSVSATFSNVRELTAIADDGTAVGWGNGTTSVRAFIVAPGSTSAVDLGPGQAFGISNTLRAVGQLSTSAQWWKNGSTVAFPKWGAGPERARDANDCGVVVGTVVSAGVTVPAKWYRVMCIA